MVGGEGAVSAQGIVGDVVAETGAVMFFFVYILFHSDIGRFVFLTLSRCFAVV